MRLNMCYYLILMTKHGKLEKNHQIEQVKNYEACNSFEKRSKSFCSNRDSSILTIWKERFGWISTFSNWIWECCKKYEWFFWSHVHSPTWNKIHRNGDEFGSMLLCYEQFKLDFLKFVTFWSVKFLFVTFLY